MNWYFVTAGGLSVLAGPLHSMLGERLIFKQLFQQTLPAISGSEILTKQVLRMFWHMIGITWWGVGAILVHLALARNRGDTEIWIGVIIASTFLASAIYAFVATRGRHFSWGIFLVIAVLSGLGTL